MKQLLALLVAANLAAALTGSEVLDRVRAVTNAKDRQATATMTITDKGNRVQTRALRTVMKGDNKLMMTFKSPADLRGVTFLTTSSDNMWIYLPAQGRVRRISGSAVDQGFGGSDFSFREISNLSFADNSATQPAESTAVDGKPAWFLTVKDKDGAASRIWVEQARYLPLRVEKLGADGKAKKRIEFGNFVNRGESWIPVEITIHDLSRGSRTELKLDSLKLNTGVKDGYFTEANMKKGA